MTLGLTHRFEPGDGSNPIPLLLLHGTGGDENDLVPLGQALAPGAALLSPRGPVLEHGMPRFFRRLAEGIFDPIEVRERTLALADFVEAGCRHYGLRAPIAVGFSNGANVAATMMVLRPGVLAGAILLRPMMVLDDRPGDLEDVPVLIVSGATDPIVPRDSVDNLASLLRSGGADVHHRWVSTGHGLVQQDVALASAWLRDRP
ncbi:alpha/beta hydrolase [Lichenifustis flavocetrariae]|uniref:Alpha/beta hydrolase n=1 Tax=Lichenifustis flavocetrariae TaxID=2949735 RepID=A0AA41YZ55_9HYPH|nr:alpha/beta hydrolase [Lichenifustis flavocetrariae]MCW6509778.1 alpha/beta hydrolase [Lichenifustis flavocetrariae]